jgi:hypothetical protein
MTYTWDIGGTGHITTVPTITTGNLTATTTYTVTVRNAHGNTSAVSNTGTITVYPALTAGSITTATGYALQGLKSGITIANSVAASGGSGNITYQWRRSGTSSATLTDDVAAYPVGNDASNYTDVGTYTFKRYARDGACNADWEVSTGQYTLTVFPCPPNSLGVCTWICGTQVWSGALRNAAGCAKVTAMSTLTTPPAQYLDYSTSYGYYYNWTCANTAQSSLCPSPWRVPTKFDLQNLEASYLAQSCTPMTPYGGIVYAGQSTPSFHDNTGYLWSVNTAGTNKASMIAYTAGWVGVGIYDLHLGGTIRCVWNLQ